MRKRAMDWTVEGLGLCVPSCDALGLALSHFVPGSLGN